MEDSPSTKGMASSVKIGLASIFLAVGYVVVMASFVLDLNFLVAFLWAGTVLALLVGGGLAIVGLANKRGRRELPLWQHLLILTSIVTMLLVVVGPADPFELLNWRMRALVARTGGRDELQSWAISILEEYPNHVEDEFNTRWEIPRELYSKQVRLLSKRRVYVDTWLLADDQASVVLGFGSGFLHGYIVIGRPGSIPNPNVDEMVPDSFWMRWGDGVYLWVQC